MVTDCEIREYDGVSLNDVHSKLHENQSGGSKVHTEVETHVHTLTILSLQSMCYFLHRKRKD